MLSTHGENVRGTPPQKSWPLLTEPVSALCSNVEFLGGREKGNGHLKHGISKNFFFLSQWGHGTSLLI